MTRVEPATPVAPQPARKFRLPMPKFSLGRLLKLAIFVGIVWVFVQVARSGVWNIPGISKLVYRAPSPIRIVQPMVPSTGDIRTRAATAQTTGYITLHEAELSAIAEQGNQKLHLGLADVQTVITENTIELSFLMPKRNNAVVRLDLEPVVTEKGDPDFRVVRSRIGQLDVPQWLVGEPARRLLQLQLQPAFTLVPDIRTVAPTVGTLEYRFTST